MKNIEKPKVLGIVSSVLGMTKFAFVFLSWIVTFLVVVAFLLFTDSKGKNNVDDWGT